MGDIDYELVFLVSLNGQEFRTATRCTFKIETRPVATRNRPQGVKYSLTLHDQANRRIYGHRRMVRYTYRGAAELLADFYREVERILGERGAS